MGTTYAVIRALIDHGHLRSHGIQGRRHAVINREDITRFMETYVSLHPLAAERR